MQHQDSVYDHTKPWSSLPERQVSDVLAFLATQTPACWTPPTPASRPRGAVKREPTIEDVLGLSYGGQ